jgi:peptidoglycan hydrolase CwlO-like protein
MLAAVAFGAFAIFLPALSLAQSSEIEQLRSVVDGLQQQLQKALQRIDQLEKERTATSDKVNELEQEKTTTSGRIGQVEKIGAGCAKRILRAQSSHRHGARCERFTALQGGR